MDTAEAGLALAQLIVAQDTDVALRQISACSYLSITCAVT
jgi:hypothetical protein